MSGVLKRNALLVSALALAMLCFFQTSKHDPDLMKVNPFADDPYDSVSSFGVQFVLFIAMLSLVRAFRSYHGNSAEEQEVVLVRGEVMGVVAVLVISLSNVIAMFRHVSRWHGVAGGTKLVWLTLGLFAGAATAGWFLYRAIQSRAMRSTAMHRGRIKWKRSALVTGATGATLLFYPEELRHSLWGELGTVLVGTTLFFIPIWAVGSALVPNLEENGDDLVDDAIAVYGRVKSATRALAPVWVRIEAVCSLRAVQPVVRLLNPRRHRWNLVLMIGPAIGGALFVAEVIVEGAAAFRGRIVLLTAVFIGLETAGICIGYALLSRPLRLFRDDDKREVME